MPPLFIDGQEAAIRAAASAGSSIGPNEWSIEELFDSLDNWTIAQSTGDADLSVAGGVLTITGEGNDVITMIHNTTVPHSYIEVLCHSRLTENNQPAGFSNRVRVQLLARSTAQPTRMQLLCGIHKHDGFSQVHYDAIRPAFDYGANVSSPSEETVNGYKDIGDIAADDVSDGSTWKPPSGTYRVGFWQMLKVAAENETGEDQSRTNFFLDVPQTSNSDNRLARYNNEASIPGIGDWFRMEAWASGNPYQWVSQGRTAAQSSMEAQIREWDVGLVIRVAGNGVGNPTTWKIQKFHARPVRT